MRYRPRAAACLSLTAGVAMLFAAAARAADSAPASPTVGPPIPLIPAAPTASTAPPAAAGRTMRNSAAISAKHPAVPVERAPLDAKPLIPPASLPVRIGAPPQPHPALPLQTDLQPLAPANTEPVAPPPPPGSAAAKPPSS